MTLYLPLQSKVVKIEEDMDFSDTQSPMDQSRPEDTSTQENTVDSTVHTEHQGEEETQQCLVAFSQNCQING